MFDRLTHHSTFTGSHKARFNADGRGLGRSGRLDAHERIGSLDTMVDRSRPRLDSDSPLYCGGATPQDVNVFIEFLTLWMDGCTM